MCKRKRIKSHRTNERREEKKTTKSCEKIMWVTETKLSQRARSAAHAFAASTNWPVSSIFFAAQQVWGGLISRFVNASLFSTHNVRAARSPEQREKQCFFFFVLQALHHQHTVYMQMRETPARRETSVNPIPASRVRHRSFICFLTNFSKPNTRNKIF